MFNARKSFSSSLVRERSQPPFFQAASFEYYKHNFTSFSGVTSTLGFLKSIPKRWYFSECKHKQKKSCVLDLNDALLRLYLPPKNRNEKNKNKKLCYKLYHQLLKQKFSREISSLCFRAHQFGIHH